MNFVPTALPQPLPQPIGLPGPGATDHGFARLTYSPKPTGLVGPNARTTGHWGYGLWDRTGFRCMGGTAGGDDLDIAIAHVRKMAAGKGMDDPQIEIVSPTGRVRTLRRKGG